MKTHTVGRPGSGMVAAVEAANANEAALAALHPEPGPVTIVVTRHAALVEYLREQGVINGDVQVYSQVGPDDVRGRRVIGVLPLYLAALADSVTTVDMDIPVALRGAELTLEDLREYVTGISTYRVHVVGAA